MTYFQKEPLDMDSRTKTTGKNMHDQVKATDMHSEKATFFKNVLKDLIAEAVDAVIAIIEIL